MFRTSASRIGAPALAVAALLSLTACGGPDPDPIAACRAIFEAERPGLEGEHVVLVYDTSASVSAEALILPKGLDADLQEASKSDGSLTVILVEGEGVDPRILANAVPLSTLGERDRPSVPKIAEAMPSCVVDVLLDGQRPSAPGTDLGRAVSTASNLVGEGATVWLWSDFLWTSGDGALDKNLLSKSPQEAAAESALAHGIRLDGVMVKAAGIANTSVQGFTPRASSWLSEYAREVCTAWGAEGCDAIKHTPVNAVPGAADLPEDVVPPFPETSTECVEGGTLFEVPSAFLFAGDSAELRDDAREALAEPLQLLLDNPMAKAEIVGHTASSSRYTADELKGLSERRAHSVAQVLRDAGIEQDRLAVRGVGDQEPKAEDLDANGTQNDQAAGERRVDVIVTGTERKC